MLALGSVGPTDPDDPTKPPFEEKRYTVKIEYNRVDVKRPDLMWKVPAVTIFDRNVEKPLFTELMAKKDDYHYEKQFSNVLETESYSNCYYIYGNDPSRWDGTNDTVIVGDRFILIVVETGSILELTNIV